MNAQELESAFLARLGDAQDLYDQIVETRAWMDLGWDTFADWWDQRVKPTMRALSMRPTPELAAAVVEQVRAEEADLPPAQRRTQRELAELAGVSQGAPAIRPRSIPERNLSAADLETAEEVAAGRPIYGPDAYLARQAEHEGDARRDAELDALISETDVRFRKNFAAAAVKVNDLLAMDAERLAEVYSNGNWDRAVGDLLNALDAWTSRVRESYRARQRAGLRLVSGGDR